MEYEATITKICFDIGINGMLVKFNGETEGFVSLSNLTPKQRLKFPQNMTVGNTINVKIIRTDGIYNDLVALD